VTISVDGSGVTRAKGIPLSNTNLRDGAFRAMAAAGLKGSFVLTPITNATQESNVLQTLQSMSRAGLFDTNRPKEPNPYE
jgi:hypothetical protein